jgi:hypothetical protein
MGRYCAVVVVLGALGAGLVGCSSGHGGLGNASPSGTRVNHSDGGLPVGPSLSLRRRVQHAGCQASALPDRRCSPGAVWASAEGRSFVCGDSLRGYAKFHPPSRVTRDAVEQEYGNPPGTVIAYVVPAEIGGSSDIANLFATSDHGQHSHLGAVTRRAVCSGKMSLVAAQRLAAADWLALYRKLR